MTTKKQTRKAGIHLHKTAARRILTATTPDYKPAEWYWILIAKNGKTIARSSETYTRKRGAVQSIKVAAKLFWDNSNQYMYYDHSKPNSPLTSYLK
jgi:uncharacterized protein YegP (UPF0339 family)